MGTTSRITRRNALKIGATAAALPLVHIRTAGAAGKLSIGFWDHWVPAGNDVMKKQVAAWADKNKVEVQSDFITTNGNKLLLTTAAEEQAKTGHDVLTFLQWDALNHQDSLEPMDDVMKRLSDAYGPVNEICAYTGKAKGHWLGVPSSSGAQNKGPCGRISILKEAAGLDVQAMYPARDEHTALADTWTYETMLKAAEACNKVGKTFGIGLGQTGDSVDTAGSMFAAYGAELVNAKGEITIKSDNVRQVLEYAQKLVKFLPADAVSYDDASNNRALISGKSALIWNPPSAWAVAKRDNISVAEDCWTFPAPAGPEGPVHALCAVLLGRVEVQPEQGRGEGPDRIPVAAPAGGGALHGGGRLRPAAVRKHERLQGVGRGRAAEGDRLQLPDPQIARHEGAYRRQPGAARYRRADLQPRHHADHARQAAERADHSPGDRLGQRRVGRLHPLAATAWTVPGHGPRAR